MKLETLLIGNKYLEQIKWCDKVIDHINRKDNLTFNFKVTGESKEYFNCPDWLVNIIKANVIEYREDIEDKFKNLSDEDSVEKIQEVRRIENGV